MEAFVSDVSKFPEECAKLVKLASTAKKVALRWLGADLAIQAKIGIMETCPSGLSKAVLKIAMKRASTTPLVMLEVQLCTP